jgi:hypothetical protein
MKPSPAPPPTASIRSGGVRPRLHDANDEVEWRCDGDGVQEASDATVHNAVVLLHCFVLDERGMALLAQMDPPHLRLFLGGLRSVVQDSATQATVRRSTTRRTLAPYCGSIRCARRGRRERERERVRGEGEWSSPGRGSTHPAGRVSTPKHQSDSSDIRGHGGEIHTLSQT